MFYRFIIACVIELSTAAYVRADEITVAVAANFLGSLQQLKPDFEMKSGHRLKISSGSTGKLYALIKQGAPYDVFLAARAKEVQALEQESYLVPNSRATYAFGRLVLWSTTFSELPTLGEKSLLQNKFHTLSIANPLTAPFGAAASEFLANLGLREPYSFRLVRAEDVGQAMLYASTGQVDGAFVAYSQVLDSGNKNKGHVWLVPEKLYQPIEQQGAVLARSMHQKAAYEFMSFLASPQTKQRLQNMGYGVSQK